MISVLYVDDEPHLLEITKAFLEKTEEFTIYPAISVDEGFRILSEQEIDVIISDYQMPVKDGIAFLKKFRSLPDKRPFILFTGRGREEVVIEAINSGVDFYIQKGGDPRSQFAELAMKIRQGYARYQAEQQVGKKHEELLAAYEQLAASEEELKANFEELASNRQALWESEKRLFEIINFLPDPTFAIDSRGTIITWNKAIEEMTGYRADYMIGKGDFEHALPFYGERIPILIDYIITNSADLEKRYDNIHIDGKVVSAETAYPVLHGKPMIAWCIATPFYNEKGEIIGAIESIRDITLQKQNEEKLRKSEELYRGVIENIQDGYYRTDVNGNLILASPSFTRLFEYDSPDEILNKSISATFYDKPEKRKEFLKKLDNEGFIENEEVVVKKKNGNLFTVAVSSHYYCDAQGKIAGVEGIFRDITKNKQIENELKIRNEYLQAVIEYAPIGIQIYEIDEEERLILTGRNVTGDNILNIDSSGYIGKPLGNTFPPILASLIPDIYANIRKTGDTFVSKERIPEDDKNRMKDLYVFAYHPVQRMMVILFLDNDMLTRQKI